MTRILLYSDEPVVARGLQAILQQADGFDLLPTCTSIASVMEQLALSTPDVLLLDFTSEITLAVLSDLRPVMTTCKVVLWVGTIATELAFQAMGLGVRGILRKTLPAELQIKCLAKVHAGELWFEKALTDSFLCAKRFSLTNREGQLVTLLSQGLKNKEIATALNISEGTVKVYLSRLFQKVGVKDRFELALFGLKNLATPNGQVVSGTIAGLRSIVVERPVQRPQSLPPTAMPMTREPGPTRHWVRAPA